MTATSLDATLTKLTSRWFSHEELSGTINKSHQTLGIYSLSQNDPTGFVNSDVNTSQLSLKDENNPFAPAALSL